MRLIPYHRFEINAGLTRADALAAISSRIEERKWFRMTWPGSNNDERFDGSVAPNGTFNITRIMGYRNSFAPVIEGEVHEAGRFSHIKIVMRPSFIVLGLFGMLTLIFLTALSISGMSAFIGVAMFVLIYAIVMGGFWFEATKIEQTLRKIFRAT